VIVIGSGVGGSAVGALLANTGKYRVTLIEKSGLIGGRFASYDKDGFRLDVGCHMLANCDRGLFGRASMSAAAGLREVAVCREAFAVGQFQGAAGPVPLRCGEDGLLKRGSRSLHEVLFGYSRLSDADCDRLNDTSISDYVSKYVKFGPGERVDRVLAIYFVTRDDETPIGEYARCQNEIWRNKAIGYPSEARALFPGVLPDHQGARRQGPDRHGVRQIVVGGWQGGRRRPGKRRKNQGIS
jgi:hypothetical protein